MAHDRGRWCAPCCAGLRSAGQLPQSALHSEAANVVERCVIDVVVVQHPDFQRESVEEELVFGRASPKEQLELPAVLVWRQVFVLCRALEVLWEASPNSRECSTSSPDFLYARGAA
eukprot:6473129-Amphidinium_carterae.2